MSLRADVFVPSASAEAQVRFYVDELGLFEVAHDYGMGSLLLRHIHGPSFCLSLQPGRAPCREQPLFCISTPDARSELARLSAVSFSSGGIVPGGDGSARLFEYPLGLSFTLRDASGNMFIISEWHPAAL